jgi:hypothetical protein
MTLPWNPRRQRVSIRAIASSFNMENIRLPGNHPIAATCDQFKRGRFDDHRYFVIGEARHHSSDGADSSSPVAPDVDENRRRSPTTMHIAVGNMISWPMSAFWRRYCPKRREAEHRGLTPLQAWLRKATTPRRSTRQTASLTSAAA